MNSFNQNLGQQPIQPTQTAQASINAPDRDIPVAAEPNAAADRPSTFANTENSQPTYGGGDRFDATYGLAAPTKKLIGSLEAEPARPLPQPGIDVASSQPAPRGLPQLPQPGENIPQAVRPLPQPSTPGLNNPLAGILPGLGLPGLSGGNKQQQLAQALIGGLFGGNSAPPPLRLTPLQRSQNQVIPRV